MVGSKLSLVGSLMLPFALGLSGCGASTSSQLPEQDSKPSAAGKSNDDHEDDAGQAQESSQDPEVVEALAELSPEDRSLAERQKICPVTGELLGSMGAPIKVDVNGKPVFICCEGCKEKLLKKPDEYLAKLNMDS
jgi:Cu(I)/Ag(I) efflux system membrane fusion protein